MTAQRITSSQVGQLIEGRSEDIALLIERTISNINSVEESLAIRLRWIEDATQRVGRELASGGFLNELGEFQNKALEADRLIALRHAHYQTLGALIGDDVTKVARREF